jgi:hypothetical protein
LRLARRGGYTPPVLAAFRGGILHHGSLASMTVTQDDLALARRAGRLAAETFDARLREVEEREREELIRRRYWSAGETYHSGLTSSPHSLWRLQQDVTRLASFHQAVLRSRAWRVVQWARRLVGRAW